MQAQDLAAAIAALLDEHENVKVINNRLVLSSDTAGLTVTTSEALAAGPAELVARLRATSTRTTS
jgi:hypothetical protein